MWRRQLPESPANTQRGPFHKLSVREWVYICASERQPWISLLLHSREKTKISSNTPPPSPERKGTSEEPQSGGVSSAERSALSFGGSFFVSTCHTQLSVQVPEGERVLQSPMGPFQTPNKDANHFCVKTSKCHRESNDDRKDRVIIPLCLQ